MRSSQKGWPAASAFLAFQKSVHDQNSSGRRRWYRGPAYVGPFTLFIATGGASVMTILGGGDDGGFEWPARCDMAGRRSLVERLSRDWRPGVRVEVVPPLPQPRIPICAAT